MLHFGGLSWLRHTLSFYFRGAVFYVRVLILAPSTSVTTSSPQSVALPFLPLDLQALSQRVVQRPGARKPTMLRHLPSRLPARMWSRISEKQVNSVAHGGLGHWYWHQGWAFPAGPGNLLPFHAGYPSVLSSIFPSSLPSSFKDKQRAAEGHGKSLF